MGRVMLSKHIHRHKQLYVSFKWTIELTILLFSFFIVNIQIFLVILCEQNHSIRIGVFFSKWEERNIYFFWLLSSIREAIFLCFSVLRRTMDSFHAPIKFVIIHIDQIVPTYFRLDRQKTKFKWCVKLKKIRFYWRQMRECVVHCF